MNGIGANRGRCDERDDPVFSELINRLDAEISIKSKMTMVQWGTWHPCLNNASARKVEPMVRRPRPVLPQPSLKRTGSRGRRSTSRWKMSGRL